MPWAGPPAHAALLRPWDPHAIRADRAEHAGDDLRRRLHAAERPVRRLLLLDPDPDVAAEIRIALPFDLDQEIGDALEQGFFCPASRMPRTVEMVT